MVQRFVPMRWTLGWPAQLFLLVKGAARVCDAQQSGNLRAPSVEAKEHKLRITAGAIRNCAIFHPVGGAEGRCIDCSYVRASSRGCQRG
jgi:hypothetical protein